MANSYYITTPIYYVNDKPHIGHAYTTIACDVLARWQRLQHPNKNVFFLTGTDEHGQKILQSAEKKSINPKDFVDEVAKSFINLTKQVNASNDAFIRTTDAKHIQAAQHFWKVLHDNNYIYLGNYSGWYSTRDEAFYTEDELIDGKAPTGSEVKWLEEESYFFKLSAFEDKLLEFYQQNPNFIAPNNRVNEIVSFIKSGLQDLSISRKGLKWGVPVTNNPSHTMYVWLDALVNYLSAIDYPNSLELWPADIHVVGKDILRFHAIYWPAFLMAADLPLPKKIFAHGWWTNNGEKISKSLGNTIDPIQLINDYGLDQVRYFLLREVPFGQDGDFSHQALIRRINADLANDLGNLIQRYLGFCYKNNNQQIPPYLPDNSFTTGDLDLIKSSISVTDKLDYLISDNQQLHKALEEIWLLIAQANKYFNDQQPWVAKKQNPQRMLVILSTTRVVIRNIALLLEAFMPQISSTILNSINFKKNNDLSLKELLSLSIPHADIINKPQPIFAKIDHDH
jgi:methionyl-tRNA synthetase